MPSTEKVEKVAALKERIEGSQALLLADYRGLSVHDATEVRRSLSDAARFSVVKNTLMRRAAGEAGIDALDRLLEGPTAVAFVFGDPVAAAKRIVEAARRFPALVLKGAYVEGKVLSAEDARALAELESREVMLSRVAGMLRSEMSRAASMLRTLQGRFLALLDAYKEKLPSSAAMASEDMAVSEEVAAEEVAVPEAESIETVEGEE
ncbi:MAG: 50S ribosomal protein L10 [Actinomycetota bacterium]